MIPQSIVDLVEICFLKGVRNAIISPGSRNAPLTIAFVRHKGIRSLSIPDERSAAFIALGLAQTSKTLSVLVCTSGSAAYNYAPAVAEAYFSETPLLILTADRPAEWIGQLDGQTIFQDGIFGKHVKKSFSFPSNEAHKDSSWFGHRMVNEAINLCLEKVAGPVHVNVPLREPFYPEQEDSLAASDSIKLIEIASNSASQPLDIFEKSLLLHPKILVVMGQMDFDPMLVTLITESCNKHNIPIIADVICNMNDSSEIVRHHDVFLRLTELHEMLAPDLIITVGKSVISKNLKLFIRNHKPAAQWHIQPTGEVADTYQSLTNVIRCEPHTFFAQLESNWETNTSKSFLDLWHGYDKKAGELLSSEIENIAEFHELKVVDKALKEIPEDIMLHLANSMMIRYVNFLGLSNKRIEVFCNRGTSGIDGSVSTAVGCALATKKQVLLMTGDMAFFYDRNAFWHNHIPSNLKVIVLNNHGGGIFRLIKGPSQQPELEEFFETKQMLSARNLANEFNLKYLFSNDTKSLEHSLPEFLLSNDRATILEIETNTVENKRSYDQILAYIAQNLI